MADKLMDIPNDDTKITPSLDYNKWLKPLDTQPDEPINHDLIKVPKNI